MKTKFVRQWLLGAAFAAGTLFATSILGQTDLNFNGISATVEGAYATFSKHALRLRSAKVCGGEGEETQSSQGSIHRTEAFQGTGRKAGAGC